MSRIFLSLFCAILLSVSAFSQAYEGNVEYNKKKQPAIMIDYAYPTEAVENAIVRRMEILGHTGKSEKGLFNKDKGFIIFANSFITDISSDRLDYVVKVDRKSRKEKDESTLYLVMNKDGANALPSMDAVSVGKAKAFLNNLIPDIEEANLELQIKEQEEVVAKSEKKFKEMQSDKTDLEKKLKNLGDDIEKQQKDIENQRGGLDGLKGKRKSASSN